MKRVNKTDKIMSYKLKTQNPYLYSVSFHERIKNIQELLFLYSTCECSGLC